MMKKLFIQPLFIGLLLIFTTSTMSFAEKIVMGIDKKTGNDKVLLHGKFLGSNDRIVYLDNVTPLCKGQRSFRVRHKDPKVHLKKDNEVWFWLFESCGSKDDAIDIITKP